MKRHQDISYAVPHDWLPDIYNTDFLALYVQTPSESPDRINLSVQRHLLNHFKLVTELGGELIQVASPNIIQAILNVCREHHVTTVCIGQPTLNWSKIFKISRYGYFLKNLSEMDIKLIIFPQ